jgi:transcriptional regulator with XRE-family HTH domain
MPPSKTVSPLRQKLGVELRRLREAAGMTADGAAARLEISASTISRSETGQVQPHPRDVDAMCRLYGVTDTRTREALVALARKSRERGWWYRLRKNMSPELLNFCAIESGAATVSSYQNMILPGTLQTPEYSRVLTNTLIHPDSGQEIDLDNQIEIRALRQRELFASGKHSVSIVLDEQVLTRPIAPTTVMKAQMELLLDVAGLDNVTLQIVPFSVGAYAGLGGPFTLFGFAPPIELDIVHVENHGRNYMVESDATIRYYELVFRRVQESALPAAETLARVKEIAEGL